MPATSALAALAGSAIGALASFATTWLTQHYQDRVQRRAQEMTRQEKLYGDFIDAASKLFADALIHDLDDPSKIVPLYAIMSKLRLFATERTTKAADAVVRRVIETYYAPNEDFHIRHTGEPNALDVLSDFTEACRAELGGR
jgi:hypothetical protein